MTDGKESLLVIDCGVGFGCNLCSLKAIFNASIGKHLTIAIEVLPRKVTKRTHGREDTE